MWIVQALPRQGFFICGQSNRTAKQEEAYTMRIDKYLKVSRLVKRRTLAKEVCEHGHVAVNGKVVKPGYEVSVGDALELRLPSGVRRVVIEKILENVPAKAAAELYREV